jgi:hypothetical protein
MGDLVPDATDDSVTTPVKGKLVVAKSNGLSVTSGKLSLAVASTTAYGAVKVTAANGLSITTGTIAMALASTTSAGALLQLNGTSTTYLNGSGAWSTPDTNTVYTHPTAIQCTVAMPKSGGTFTGEVSMGTYVLTVPTPSLPDSIT